MFPRALDPTRPEGAPATSRGQASDAPPIAKSCESESEGRPPALERCASAVAEGAAMRGRLELRAGASLRSFCTRRVCEVRKRVGPRHPSDQRFLPLKGDSSRSPEMMRLIELRGEQCRRYGELGCTI
jgi:hypothetical protein